MPYRIKFSNGVEEIQIESDDISDIDTIIKKVEQLKQLFTEKSRVDFHPKTEEESYLGKS
jgi:hypothetical protein